MSVRTIDGGHVFVCTSCGYTVYTAIRTFDQDVCATCRWYDERPWIPKPKKESSDEPQPIPGL